MIPKIYFIIKKLFSAKAYPVCFLLVSGILAFTCLDAAAQGNLLVTPKRVVFEGSKRSEELNLANIGKDSATYDISFIQIKMNEDGSVEKITAPDSMQNFADKYLRFFPRTVTLAPNEAQTVKVQIVKSAEINPGEYRSHLYFRAVPNEKPLGDKDETKDSSISVKLIPIFGISMPVIIRVGETNTQLNLSDISVSDNDTNPTMHVTLNRKGNMSVYGDVSVDYISPDNKSTHVGVAKGLAVYTPNTVRHFNLPLTKTPGINYHSGKLHVIYTSEQSAKDAKLADEYFSLN